jgi:DNA-binding HxlR family transcriptional regulator
MDIKRQMSNNIKCCPIETTLTFFGRKWAVNILRDLFFGKKRFSDFLKSNPQLSSKVLSLRLKELENYGIIEKRIVSKTPVLIEYGLTQKGKALNKILYEMAKFSMEQSPGDVFYKIPKSISVYIPVIREMFDLE